MNRFVNMFNRVNQLPSSYWGFSDFSIGPVLDRVINSDNSNLSKNLDDSKRFSRHPTNHVEQHSGYPKISVYQADAVFNQNYNQKTVEFDNTENLNDDQSNDNKKNNKKNSKSWFYKIDFGAAFAGAGVCILCTEGFNFAKNSFNALEETKIPVRVVEETKSSTKYIWNYNLKEGFSFKQEDSTIVSSIIIDENKIKNKK